MLAFPELDPAISYLEALNNPTVDLRMALMRNPADSVNSLRGLVVQLDVVQQAFATQRPDGSWGDKDHPGKRLLPTLWMVKALGEIGLDKTHAGWRNAVGFLSAVGHTDDGVFSIWGNRDGVLSCYVGIAAIIYLEGGLDDLAAPQIDWIERYQELRTGGRDLRNEPAEEWGPHLKTKYGGCMAETTCLVGLLRAGRALAAWDRPGGRRLVEAIREVFLERRIMYTATGSIVPLAVSANKADSWLAPSFPLDWRVDLIEAVGFVAHTGPSDSRLQKAVDCIAGYQLSDGTWPLHRAYRPDYLPGLERRSTKRSSPMITLRVIEALWPLVG